MDNQSVAGRYTSLATDRQPYLERAREGAKLTIPALMPPEGSGGATKLYTPFQSMGARGVNNLASKLLLTLFPPNSPFFRMLIDDIALEKITQREGMRGQIEEALGKVERVIQAEMETSHLRIVASEVLKHLIVAGNVFVWIPQKESPRMFKLDRYVVCRDPMGNVLTAIIKEDLAKAALPDDLRELVDDAEKSNDTVKSLELYTLIERKDGRWRVSQYLKDKLVPGSEGDYPLDKPPFIALRFNRMDGEHYGRGYVEEYLGDLASLEGLSQAIVEGSAAAARMLILVKPNGTTKRDDVAKAPNGAVRSGDADEVSVVQMNKASDFRVAKETVTEISQRLGFAFLLNTAVQRGGERVTAEEIRYMARELEDALGGTYSILSQEFQMPLVVRYMHRMESQGRLPALPKGLVRPAIITGLEALGRGHDLNRLDAFVAGARETVGEQALQTYLSVGDYFTRRAAALGIDPKGLIRTEEEVAASQQQNQMNELIAKLGPNAVNALGGMAKEGMKQNVEGPAPAQ